MALIALSRDVELIYSPDDAERCGRGYYLQRWPEQSTSPLYRTQGEATKAFNGGIDKIKWDA